MDLSNGVRLSRIVAQSIVSPRGDTCKMSGWGETVLLMCAIFSVLSVSFESVGLCLVVT